MRFAVHFIDDDEHGAKREEFMGEHLKFLERNSQNVLAAGPLLDAETGANAGGQWIVEAQDASDVEHLVRSDPFYGTGLRKEIRILEWKIVFDGGRVVR